MLAQQYCVFKSILTFFISTTLKMLFKQLALSHGKFTLKERILQQNVCDINNNSYAGCTTASEKAIKYCFIWVKKLNSLDAQVFCLTLIKLTMGICRMDAILGILGAVQDSAGCGLLIGKKLYQHKMAFC